MAKIDGRNRFPDGKHANRINPLVTTIADKNAEIDQLNGQLQHLSAILWLSLENGGDLIVDVNDMRDWPASRAVRGYKVDGSSKVVWTSKSPQSETATE